MPRHRSVQNSFFIGQGAGVLLAVACSSALAVSAPPAVPAVPGSGGAPVAAPPVAEAVPSMGEQGPQRPQPLVTAPSLKPNPVFSAAPIVLPAKDAAASTAAGDAGVPHALPPELHVWPLRYREPPPLNALMLDVPVEADARLMLPGRAADHVANARYAANKYINDTVGLAAQARGRQQDAWERWLEQTDAQARKLDSSDAWQAYQFRLEARREVEQYREKIAGQAAISLQRMASDVRDSIAKITPIMALMPTYELKMGWYGILVQLKEGVTLYQGQITNADRYMLRKLDDYLAANPTISRPAGVPPERGAVAIAKKAVTDTPAPPPAKELARPAAPPPPPPTASASGSGLGFALVGLLFLAVGFVYFKLRKKTQPAAVKA